MNNDGKFNSFQALEYPLKTYYVFFEKNDIPEGQEHEININTIYIDVQGEVLPK